MWLGSRVQKTKGNGTDTHYSATRAPFPMLSGCMAWLDLDAEEVRHAVLTESLVGHLLLQGFPGSLVSLNITPAGSILVALMPSPVRRWWLRPPMAGLTGSGHGGHGPPHAAPQVGAHLLLQ